MVFAIVYFILVFCTIGALSYYVKRSQQKRITQAKQKFWYHWSDLFLWQSLHPTLPVILSREGSVLTRIAIEYCKDALTIIEDQSDFTILKNELEILECLLKSNPNPPGPGIPTTSARTFPCAFLFINS